MKKDNGFKRIRLNMDDWKFVIYLFFHSIYLFLIFEHNKSDFEWMLMKLTASGRFERDESENQNDN